MAADGIRPKVRVLRLIEYVYETPEDCLADWDRWTLKLDTATMRMRSTTLPAEILHKED